MPDEDKCKPDYWFLKRDENVDITLRETGQLTTIPPLPFGRGEGGVGGGLGFWEQEADRY